MIGFLSPTHVVVLLVVLLLLFGAKRLPELGRSLGSGMREFKTSITGDPDHDRATLRPVAAPHAQPTTAAQQPAPEPIQADPHPSRRAA
jgi:sec-independent protein translocase protein TatA